MMEITLPRDVRGIISRLNAGGYEAYAVGGCVRDSIMYKRPVDWDITTAATPEEIKSLFPRTHDTGIAHGTVTIVINHKNYEVTTFRIDGEYFDNRHPAQVTFARSLYEDLKRRDFTMNAIGYHWNTGCVDPFGGIADINSGVVRGVGDAGRRFNEDALRMLRAVRFTAQLGFEIDEKTWDALIANAYLIKNISIERVRDELLKLLGAAHPEKLLLLSKSRLIEHIDAELAEHIKTVEPVRMLAVDTDAERLVILLRGLDSAKDRLKFFKLDNKTIGLVTTLLVELETPVTNSPVHIRRRLAKIGPEVFTILTKMFEAYGENMADINETLKDILTHGDCISLSGLALHGDDLKKLGIVNGMEIGRTLERLFAHVLEHPEDNTPDALIQYI